MATSKGLIGRWSVVVALACAIATALPAAQTRESLLRFVNRTVPATVTSVVDGDTVHVRLADGQALTVRLDGIDAPESGEPFSAQARSSTRVLLFDKRVQVRGTDVDRYERLVARVTVGNADSSIELVKAGLACHFTRYSSDATLALAERDAKAKQRGFWAAGAQKPACVTGGASVTTPRPAAPAAATPRPLIGSLATTVAGPFHGNTSSRVYHAPSCLNYGCKNCTAVFQTEVHAQVAGFRPAADCVTRNEPQRR